MDSPSKVSSPRGASDSGWRRCAPSASTTATCPPPGRKTQLAPPVALSATRAPCSTSRSRVPSGLTTAIRRPSSAQQDDAYDDSIPGRGTRRGASEPELDPRRRQRGSPHPTDATCVKVGDTSPHSSSRVANTEETFAAVARSQVSPSSAAKRACPSMANEGYSGRPSAQRPRTEPVLASSKTNVLRSSRIARDPPIHLRSRTACGPSHCPTSAAGATVGVRVEGAATAAPSARKEGAGGRGAGGALGGRPPHAQSHSASHTFLRMPGYSAPEAELQKLPLRASDAPPSVGASATSTSARAPRP